VAAAFDQSAELSLRPTRNDREAVRTEERWHEWQMEWRTFHFGAAGLLCPSATPTIGKL